MKTVGFRVTVGTSTSGLRLFISPTFLLNWRYFGSPTTPFTGTLPGGIYAFGVDGWPYGSFTPDPGKFDIPYLTVTPQLNL